MMVSRLSVIVLGAVLAVVLVGGSVYISHEHAKERQMSAVNESLSGSLVQMQHQMEALSQRIADFSEAKKDRPAAAAPKPKRAAQAPGKEPALSRRPPADDPRIKEMQAHIDEQQKQLADTREDLDKAKSELHDQLDSTRDELSTSIAKNHGELLELEKRGERSYHEFQLDKSKNFDRVGPIRLSLRKADVKHKRFNMAMMVDDDQLEKSNVNLYEPVRIDVDGESLELVVNQIRKDHIEGYVSEPKYKKSDSGRDSGSQP